VIVAQTPDRSRSSRRGIAVPVDDERPAVGTMPAGSASAAIPICSDDRLWRVEESAMRRFASFREFYPYYLSEHAHPVCRRLHVVGSLLVLVVIAFALASGRLAWLLLVPVIGYGFAWIGHFVFEKNRPATFKHPLYSLAGDWVMFWDVLRGRVRL